MIKKKMLENEVQEQYVDQILKEVKSGSRKEWTLDNVLAGVYQKIILKIGQPHLIDVKTTKTKYIFFVGPTGVGKTTTIAKIASTLKLTKKNQGCADHSRYVSHCRSRAAKNLCQYFGYIIRSCLFGR